MSKAKIQIRRTSKKKPERTVTNVVWRTGRNSLLGAPFESRTATASGSVWTYHLDSSSLEWHSRNLAKPEEGSSVPVRRNVVLLGGSSLVDRKERYKVMYPALLNYVQQLADLDEDDEDFVHPMTADAAKRVLGLIAQTDSMPPRMFSHSGNAIVLTWEGSLEAYLMTISKRKVTLLHVDRRTGERSSQVFDLETDDGRATWLDVVGGTALANTAALNGF